MDALENRYKVIKIEDPEGKHKDCKYFVLDPKHDRIAEQVLWEYAFLIRRNGNPGLANDLVTWLHENAKNREWE